MTPGGRFATTRARTIVDTFLATVFALWAAVFAYSTLVAIANFGFRSPMFDQWLEYETLLDRPFPLNVIQLGNGHRPVLPNLVRLAGIHWFDADQVLQLAVGGGAAFLCAGLLAFAAWRERGIDRALRWAGVLVAVIGVLWLANARRLLHGSEALNGYLPTLAAIVATYCMVRAARTDSRSWLGAACFACVCATFSFGLGVASFGAVLLAGWLLRMPWTRLAWPVATACAAMVVYVFVLPGSDGVREQIEFAPFTTAGHAAQWIAAPWKWAWFDFATDPGNETGPGRWLQPALTSSAGAITSAVDSNLLYLLLGLAGIAAFAAFVVRLRRRPGAPGRLEIVAAGAAVYALGSGVITVAARVPFLREHPDQIFADRYLLWPSLFWCALALLAFAAAAHGRRGIARAAALAFALLLPPVFAASQNRNAIWGALIHRWGQQTAAAVRSGVYDPERFAAEKTGDEAHLREIALLKARRLAMFADASWQRLGTRWSGTLETDPGLAAQAHWLDPVHEFESDAPVGHLEGWITHDAGRRRDDGVLVILDADGTIAGFAAYSFISPTSEALLLKVRNKRGFDGYVRDWSPARKYTIALADFAANRAFRLAELGPEPGAAAKTAAAPPETSR